MMNKLKGAEMVESDNMQGTCTEVVSNNKTSSYKLRTMCHHFCLRCEHVT